MPLTNAAGAPPEVILDRFVRTTLCREPGCSGYLGKLDIDKVVSDSFRSLLHLLHRTMNEALQLEGPNASAGVQHPPFHFDYLDVNDGTENAHAFEEQKLAFIVVTLPIVELVASLSLRLVPFVPDLFGLDSSGTERDPLWGLLSQILLNFVVAHEYTHHIHRHCGPMRGVSGVWTESANGAYIAGIVTQAQELDADGYAAMLVLTHLVRGERRDSALQVLGKVPPVALVESDELLIRCFLLMVMTFLCKYWPTDFAAEEITKRAHPPAPMRIQSLINVTEMWCNENQSPAKSWRMSRELRKMFDAAKLASGREDTAEWSAHIRLLESPAYAEYRERLLEAFDELRRNSPGR